MGSFYALAFTYLLGGLTFVPITLGFVLLHAYFTFPRRQSDSLGSESSPNLLHGPDEDARNSKSGTATLTEKIQRGKEPDVAAGWFAVCREYVPGGLNGKPPERTTPAGAVITAESPSVYQSMYRSIFDRSKQVPTLDSSKGNGKTAKKAQNVFFVVLRHGSHLMLYDDTEQIEVRHVISLSSHEVSIYAGGADIPEGELWIKRNAICLTRKEPSTNIPITAKPFYFFSENCSDKEDFYFALLQNQDRMLDNSHEPPRPQQFEVKDIITLVQRLHSSEEQLQTRWINAIIGRLFLALYKTQEVEDFIRLKITKKIARVKKPAFLSAIVLQKLDMGETAPYITNPRLKDLTVEGECCVEADFKYSGNFRLEIAATARIDLGARFKAREVRLILAVVIKKLEGHALVRFKPPPSNRVWMTFETMPNMEMTIEPIVSSMQITYSIFLRAIESRIREVFAETLVLPHWDDSPFTNTKKQQFRGGIWTVDQTSPTSPIADTSVPDEEVEDEAQASMEHTLNASISPRDLHGRSQSISALVDNPHPSLAPNKATMSTHALRERIDEGFSSGVDKKPEPPRVMRSRSFASAANPIVSMDNANVDAQKTDVILKQSKDATSTMIAISNRSRPTSPTETPIGSLSPRSGPVSEHSKAGSLSSISSKANSILEQTVSQSTITKSTQPSPPPTPLSFNSASTNSAFEKGTQSSTTLKPVARTLTSLTEKRQSIPSVGAATAAAKKWGWGVITRNQEQRISSETVGGIERAGTPERPIGRGRPLPPIGQPLPHPEKRGSLASSISLPKRKPLPPPILPQRRHDGTRPRAVPTLPARRKQETSNFDSGDEGLMVVEAPPDFDPIPPFDAMNLRSIHDQGMKPNGHYTIPSTNSETAPSERDESIPFSRSTSSLVSSSYEDDENSLPIWQPAQEEEARSKSIWVQDNNEHS